MKNLFFWKRATKRKPEPFVTHCGTFMPNGEWIATLCNPNKKWDGKKYYSGFSTATLVTWSMLLEHATKYLNNPIKYTKPCSECLRLGYENDTTKNT